MPDRDYIEETLQTSYKGVFDADALYKTLYTWFKQYRYTFKELDYKNTREKGKQQLQIKWEGKRKMTDYLKFVLETTIQMKNYEKVKVKGKSMTSGELLVKIVAYLEKDYEETWSRRSWLKFIREVHDKFITGHKMKALEKELSHEMEMLRSEVKSFLNLQKLGK